MLCKDLELVLESEGLGTLSAEAREHLAECDSCQSLLADFHSIVAVAQTLPSEVEPPARVWVCLRAQLEAEGLVKQPAKSLEPVPWWESLRTLFPPRSLAIVAAGLVLVVGTVYFAHKPAAIAGNPSATQASPPQQASAPVVPTTPAPATVAEVAHAPAVKSHGTKALASSPTENLSSPVTPAEHSSPDMQLAGAISVDDSFRQNLHTLNQFIAECQRHLKQNPQDELAREYLNMAYQQKADLLAAMMDNGRSEH